MTTYPQYFCQDIQNQIRINDGTNSISLSLADFMKLEPSYKLDLGVIAVNYIRFTDAMVRLGTWKSGDTQFTMANAIWAPGDQYIANIAAYQAAITTEQLSAVNPYENTTDLASQKAVAQLLINNYYNGLMLPISLTSNAFPEVERSMFYVLLSEANAYMADKTASTPYTDAVLIPGETKDQFVVSVLSHQQDVLALAAIVKNRRIDSAGLYNSSLTTIQNIKDYITKVTTPTITTK